MSHSGDALSVMYGWLADEDTRRNLTNEDLSLLGNGGDGGPLRARPRSNIAFPVASLRLPSSAFYWHREEDESSYETVDRIFEADDEFSSDWLLLLLEEQTHHRKFENSSALDSRDSSGLSEISDSIADALYESWQPELMI